MALLPPRPDTVPGIYSAVVDLDAYRPHAVGHVACRACGHHHVGVVDMRADFDNLRCSACDQMTAAMQPEPPEIGEVRCFRCGGPNVRQVELGKDPSGASVAEFECEDCPPVPPPPAS